MTAQQTEIGANPFAVKTPENLEANELVDLFVPYPEFENLQVGGHQFLHGHRGSGKSMMLRMMSPDSQMLWRGCALGDLSYFGVYLSIKATELNAPEYARLEAEAASSVLSEHVLTTKVMSALFSAVEAHCSEHLESNGRYEELLRLLTGPVFNKFRYAGWEGDPPEPLGVVPQRASTALRAFVELIDKIHLATVQYIKRRSLPGISQPYQGALLGFQDVLLPTIQALRDARVIPDSPVFFLLDDADNLTEHQTRILNTWVSYRTTNLVSLKISTQLNYKHYATTSGMRIESPHDFSSINFTSVHTGSVKERYPGLVHEIVQKRLSRYGVSDSDPYNFFPEDEAQKAEIKKIEEEYKHRWHEGKSGSYRAADDAYRYARPEYIRRLSGAAKQGARYRYAGFEQLVHVSSGIIRFFLEPAARMFTEQLLANAGSPVTAISPAIQDQELRKQADQLLLEEFERLIQEADENREQSGHQLSDVERLRNIVYGIGALFKAHLMDEDATQRRVFSFSLSDDLTPEMRAIFKLGISHGYFYVDSIGSKSGMGRSPLYVLTRRLAPAFSLDPIGFSSYLTVQNGFLVDISINPGRFIYRLRKRKVRLVADTPIQLSMLEGDDDA